MADPALARRRRDGLPRRPASSASRRRPSIPRRSSARRSRPSSSACRATGTVDRGRHRAGPGDRRGAAPGRRRARPRARRRARSTIEVGDAVVVGQTVSFPVTATAEQVAVLDPAELKPLVLGKPIDEARAILAPYGDGRARRLAGLGPARSRASRAGSTLTDRPGRPDRDAAGRRPRPVGRLARAAP